MSKFQRLSISLALVLSLPAFPLPVNSQDSGAFGLGKGNPTAPQDGAFGVGKSPQVAKPEPIEQFQIPPEPEPLSEPVEIVVPTNEQAPDPQPDPVHQQRQSLPISPPPQTTYQSPAPTLIAPPPTQPVPVIPTYPPAPKIFQPMQGFQGLPSLPGSKQNVTPANINLRYPLLAKVPITSSFGWRRDPVYGGRSFHEGLDLGAPFGAPVIDAASGHVVTAGWCGGYGYCVKIDHGGYLTLYAHLSKVFVQKNMTIGQGQTIGEVGSTGKSTGPHLHFEVQRNGEAIDPLGLLASNLDNQQAKVHITPLSLLPRVIVVASQIS